MCRLLACLYRFWCPVLRRYAKKLVDENFSKQQVPKTNGAAFGIAVDILLLRALRTVRFTSILKLMWATQEPVDCPFQTQQSMSIHVPTRPRRALAETYVLYRRSQGIDLHRIGTNACQIFVTPVWADF